MENYITEPDDRSSKILELNKLIQEMNQKDVQKIVWQAPVAKRDEFVSELNKYIFSPI